MKLRKTLAALTLTAAALAATLTPALAASVTSVAFTDVGTRLVAVGTVGGAPEGTQVNLTMAGSATVLCLGPGNQLELRTGVPVSNGGAADRLDAALAFDVGTDESVVTPENAGCHRNSTVVVTDVAFARAVITVGAVEMFGYRNDPVRGWVPA